MSERARDWIRQVPENWKVAKLRHLSTIHRGASPRPIDDPKYFDEAGDHGWVRISDVTASRKYLLGTEQRLSVLGSSLSVKLGPGRLVLSIAATVGVPILTGINCCIHDGFVTFDRLQLNPEYLYYILLSGAPFGGLGKLGTQLNLNTNIVGDIRVPVPPLDEQRAIVDFLDSETACLDTLIKSKTDLIERFQEKRRSYIAEVCFRGLNRTAPAKASGMPTAGQVPSHWTVIRNKILFREVDQRSLDGTEELLTVSHITGVTRRSEKPEVTMFMAESLEGYKKCQRNDLIINTMWAWMGALGISGSDGVVSPGYNVYRLKQKAIPKFFDLLYRTPQYITEFTRWSKGVWESRLRLYPFEFLQILTPVPPVHEQQAIVDAIERETGGLTTAIATLEKSISTLREYRSALISAAVTGQIDVRNYRPQEVAAACQ